MRLDGLLQVLHKDMLAPRECCWYVSGKQLRSEVELLLVCESPQKLRGLVNYHHSDFAALFCIGNDVQVFWWIHHWCGYRRHTIRLLRQERCRFLLGTGVFTKQMVLLAASAPGRPDLADVLLLLDNAGIARRWVFYAAGTASFPTLCLPLLAEVTLFIDRERPLAEGVKLFYKGIARRMRLVSHLLSWVNMTFFCSNSQ